MRKRQAMYPAIKPYNTGYMPVDGRHRIYFEESGNPKGKPAVYLHGGPGGGSDGRMRRLFDPKRYRIVLLDQRGCGRSKPYASLVNNTTWHLVADLEALREHLQIDRWLVAGGSWGSTLALAYAQTHPSCVTELVLRGIFLSRKWDIEYLYQPGGTAALFPDRWEAFEALIPPAERRNMVRAYHRRLTSSYRKTIQRAARAWSVWEGATSHLLPDRREIASAGRDRLAVALARIESHYFVNRCFLREGQLLKNVKRIQRIPAVIVHGRYDVVCPMRGAWDLHRAWPEAKFRIVDDAGHSAFEPGTARELVRALDGFAGRNARTRALGRQKP
ncbi:MAG: prolyl aminopeptidase [Proteobacteria bacterium]|nr:prolyl aminopeptidase [Pseudomonadota bacterium]